MVSFGGSNFMGLPEESQRPSCVIATGTASYFWGSSACRTDSADLNETSCSPERPPKRTAIRILAGVFMFPHNLRDRLDCCIDSGLVQFKMRHHSNTEAIDRQSKNISIPEPGNEF